MLDFAWPTDIEIAITRMMVNKTITDHDYFRDTVDHIEAGWSPEGLTRLTLTALDQWESRCCRKEPDHARDPRSSATQDRPVQDQRKTIHPRNNPSVR